LNPADFADVELETLIKLFFDDSGQLGEFTEVIAEEVSEPSRSLLAHDHHMTVTVEKHHQSPVDVVVLETRTDDDHYSRKILLTRQSDDRVVQYGIVRLNMAVLSPEVRAEIEAKEIPLGRILINHDVLRVVKLLSLFEIKCGPDLAKAIGLDEGQICYGRTALIYCDGSPAIELLEIVS
jgi:chorismate-pyruvate lyase